MELINLKTIESEILVTSREIAINFEKDHRNVTRTIENLTAQNCSVKDMFIESSFEHRGNFYKEYLMNRDGFSLLVMGFTGDKALKWKLKYLKAFKDMEDKLKNPYKNMSQELQAIFSLDLKQQELVKTITDVKEDFDDFKDNAPLFNIECDEISKKVRTLGVKILGGKKSNAYKNSSIRAQVYSDIYDQIKRQFGVKSYKAIKRGQLQSALDTIEQYKLPFFLKDVIEYSNKLLSF